MPIGALVSAFLQITPFLNSRCVCVFSVHTQVKIIIAIAAMRTDEETFFGVPKLCVLTLACVGELVFVWKHRPHIHSPCNVYRLYGSIGATSSACCSMLAKEFERPEVWLILMLVNAAFLAVLFLLFVVVVGRRARGQKSRNKMELQDALLPVSQHSARQHVDCTLATGSTYKGEAQQGQPHGREFHEQLQFYLCFCSLLSALCSLLSHPGGTVWN